ncbi:hypothetical protein [Tenggerimyces flavus]|uniref:Uncharacterized protein n=1 Tax=Tenggerimyces flavus TaxID=1708749 RepID=A0ABV7YP00_9ACTN|nr:hypothetical protein [Tenggerimyces flavus]MBM7790202.1 hypothetical protein [Tenggerimyces flavus]
MDFLAVTFGALPTDPSCSGPVVVHADGAFECRGPWCPGATKVFHPSSAIDPCHPVQDVGASAIGGHACVRCAAGHLEDLGELACPGMEITHDDGRFDCSAGENCLGDHAPHMTARSCRLLGACDCGT